MLVRSAISSAVRTFNTETTPCALSARKSSALGCPAIHTRSFRTIALRTLGGALGFELELELELGLGAVLNFCAPVPAHASKAKLKTRMQKRDST